MATGLKVGTKVKVKSEAKFLHPVQKKDPEMLKYLGEEGVITMVLPPEWSFQTMYRIEFTHPDREPLAFFARELDLA